MTADAIAHPDRHRQVDHPAWRSLRVHCQGQSEDPAQDAQEAAPTRMSRPPPGATSLTGGGCGAPSEAAWAPAWVDFPAAAQGSRSDAPQPPRTARARAGTAALRQPLRRRALRWSTRVCSLPMTDAQPEVVAAWVRGHWGTSEPAPRRSETWSSMRTATSCAPATDRRSWPPCVTWPPGLTRLFHGTRASIATTRPLPRQPKRAIRLLTQPTT